MPELPEVEVFRRRLEEAARGHRIEGVRVRDTRVVKTPATLLEEKLVGRSIDETRRHGKHLFARVGDGGGWLALHFGMSGGLVRYRDDEDAPKYARLTLDLDDGAHLAFEDLRRFGEVVFVDDADRFVKERELGPDALSLDEEAFIERLRAKRSGLKAALMSQELLAGVGNLYSDEILFQARLSPDAPVASLDDAQLRDLYRVTRRVLEETIERGADPERLPRKWLLPHREKGARCPRCGTPLERRQSAGRSSWRCPSCQRTPSRKAAS